MSIIERIKSICYSVLELFGLERKRKDKAVATPKDKLERLGSDILREKGNEIIKEFYKKSILGKITSNRWSGELLGVGDMVRIACMPKVSVVPTVPNTRAQWKDLIDTNHHKIIVEGHFDFASELPEITKNPSDISMNGYVLDVIANKLRLSAEDYVLKSEKLNTIHTMDSVNWNTDGASIFGSLIMAKSTVYPDDNLFAVIHPDMAACMLRKFNSTDLHNFSHFLKKGTINGYIGRVCGLDLYASALVPGNGTKENPYMAIAGGKEAITLVMALTQFELCPYMQDYFGSGIRGQICLDFDITYPEYLVRIPVYLE